jgi:hypothetical protein
MCVKKNEITEVKEGSMKKRRQQPQFRNTNLYRTISNAAGNALSFTIPSTCGNWNSSRPSKLWFNDLVKMNNCNVSLPSFIYFLVE